MKSVNCYSCCRGALPVGAPRWASWRGWPSLRARSTTVSWCAAAAAGHIGSAVAPRGGSTTTCLPTGFTGPPIKGRPPTFDASSARPWHPRGPSTDSTCARPRWWWPPDPQTAERIRGLDNLEASVVIPPPGIDANGPEEPVQGVREDFCLTVVRPRSYKSIDLITSAARRQEQLVVVGGTARPSIDESLLEVGRGVRCAAALAVPARPRGELLRPGGPRPRVLRGLFIRHPSDRPAGRRVSGHVHGRTHCRCRRLRGWGRPAPRSVSRTTRR